MDIEVNATGPLVSKYAERLIGEAIKQGYTDLADNALLPHLTTELPGHYKKSVKKRIIGRGLETGLVVFSNEKGVKQIEEGREKNKTPPPVNAILKWVKRKGIGVKAFSIKTRRPLATGIRRTRDRQTGQLRSSAKSLQAKQLGIAIAISKRIGKEGLPRNTGFPPSHALFLFRDLKIAKAGAIDSARSQMQARIVAVLNG